MRPLQAVQETSQTAPFQTAQVSSVDGGTYQLSSPGRANTFPACSVAGEHTIGDWVVVHLSPGGQTPTIIGDSPYASG